jgi:hypothetical protein
MTSTMIPTAPATATSTRAERAVGWAAAAGTLPYLTLKAIWLSGNPVGVVDPAVMAGPAMGVLNGVTVLLDLLVVALALALTQPFGRRLPAWSLLLPMWVGTGLLLPVAISILPATLLLAAEGAGSPDFLEAWVRPLVYGGFAWQAIFLLGAFVGHARRRWADVVATPGVASRAVAPLLRVVAAGGVGTAAVSAGLHLVLAATSGSLAAGASATVGAGFAVAGAAGVLLLVRDTTAHRWLATAAAWIGSAAMFSWGLWATANTVVGTPLAVADPLAGAANLTGLLAAFALAIAGLLALLGTGVATPER